MIKNRKVAFVIFVVLFIVFWNLLDLLYSALITKEPYHFSTGNDMGLPLVSALVLGCLLFLRNKSE